MNLKKKSLILLLIFLIIITIMPTVSASFDPEEYEPDPLQGGTIIIGAGNTILGVIQVVGIIVSVAILIILGIKYMLGSVEEKASYKKSMIPYLLGAVMLFAASAFVEILYEFGMKIAGA